MRKRKSLLIAVMVIAATAATLFVGCKKEKDEAAATANRSEAQALLNRIEAFQTLRDAVNSGAKADGSMTVEEMRQTLDLMSNYEHSEHMTYCESTVLDTLHVVMPTINGEGYVSNADVVATYNAFETALEKHMLGVNDGLDVPSYFSIVMPQIGAKDDGDIDIVFTRGKEGVKYNDVTDPFGEGDDYVWGLELGLCNPVGPFNSNTDAAKELSKKFKFTPDAQHEGMSYMLYGVEYASYTPYEDGIHLENYYYYEDSTITCADRWLYYQPGDFDPEPCIYSDEMNCYFHSIRGNITLISSPLYYSPQRHSPYHECWIEAIPLYYPGDPSKRPVRVHVAHVTYGYVLWLIPADPFVDE
jgi:hypothetical protein